MSTISATRSGLDPSLLAARTAETQPMARAASLAPQQIKESGAGVSQGAALLAALYTRLDEVNAVAGSERAASGGDPSQGNPERLFKLFPPYPPESRDRVAYLDRLAGLGKQNEALTLPAERASETDVERRIQAIGQAAASALADRPNLGLSRDPARFTQPSGEGRA